MVLELLHFKDPHNLEPPQGTLRVPGPPRLRLNSSLESESVSGIPDGKNGIGTSLVKVKVNAVCVAPDNSFRGRRNLEP